MDDSRSSRVYDVRAFGATGDGLANDTQAIQQAIEHCASRGGGRLVVPPGRYLTGPLVLRSHLDLFLAPGATLKASTAIDDYYETRNSFESPRVGLIVAQEVSDVALSGSGTIDCSGLAFMDIHSRHLGSTGDFDRTCTRQQGHYMEPLEGHEDGPIVPLDRPGNAIQFINCQEVTLEGVRIVDSPNWTVNFVQCRHVTVMGLRIHNNQLVPNSDGIHLTGSEDVRITACDIRTGDDAIAITSLPTGAVPHPGPTRRVLVSDCTLESRSSGVRVGYGLEDIEDCLFTNLNIAANRGIGVFARYGGSVRNISFRNLLIHTRLHTGHWWGHGEPIHVSALPGPGGGDLGVLDHVSFSHVVARSEAGVVVYSHPVQHIRDLELDDLQLVLQGSPIGAAYGGNLDLRPSNDLSLALFARPEYGVLVHGTDRIILRHIRMRTPDQPAEYFAGSLSVTAATDFRCDRFETGAR